MTNAHVNRVSAIALVALSLVAFLAVLSGAVAAVLTASNPFHEADEGTAAHVFQLSVAGLIPITVLFLATADWMQPARSTSRLALPAVLVAVAFGLLYYFDHYR